MECVQTKAFVIYLLGPSPEGKFYVGQTGDLGRRLTTHQRAGGECPEIHRAIQRFGWELFPRRILAETELPDEADRLERFHIAAHNALFPHGYNMTTGGRSTLFDPKARVEGFRETPIDANEFRRAAQSMLEPESGTTWKEDCPLCREHKLWGWGGAACRCGTDPDMALLALRHLAAGGTVESFPLVEGAAALNRWRRSPDAEMFLATEKRRLRSARRDAGNRARVKLADILPAAACRYVQRLLPYAAEWVRRSALVARGLPCHQPGRFIAVPGGRPRLMVLWRVEDALHRYRDEMRDPVDRARRLAYQFQYASHHKKRDWPVVEGALMEVGAAADEIAAAKDRGEFLYRIQAELRPLGISATEGDARFPGLEPEIMVIPADGPNKDKTCIATFREETPWEMFLRELLASPESKCNAMATAFVEAPPDGVLVKIEEAGEPLFEVGIEGDTVWMQIGFPGKPGEEDRRDDGQADQSP